MKIELLNWRFRIIFDITKLVEVEGVNSVMGDNQHILLWDFDEEKLDIIKLCLEQTQNLFNLSDIYIVESSPEHYHAYCFRVCDLPQTLFILSSTPHIDMTFFKLGVIRGYWTLRITTKNKDQKFRLVHILKSYEHTEIALIKKLKICRYITKK